MCVDVKSNRVTATLTEDNKLLVREYLNVCKRTHLVFIIDPLLNGFERRVHAWPPV